MRKFNNTSPRVIFLLVGEVECCSSSREVSIIPKDMEINIYVELR